MPCALEAWTSEDRCMSRDDASCARTAEAGVIPGRHCGESRLASSRASFSGGLASMWCARRRHCWARCITERASKPGRRCLTSNIECHINRAAGGSANVFWQRRSGAFPWAPRAIPEPGCGLKRTVRWLMSVVRCATFKRRCAKSLSTVNRDGERAFVAPSRLRGPEGGSIFRTARGAFQRTPSVPTGTVSCTLSGSNWRLPTALLAPTELRARLALRIPHVNHKRIRNERYEQDSLHECYRFCNRCCSRSRYWVGG